MVAAVVMVIAVPGAAYIWGWKMILNMSFGLFMVIFAATAIKEYVIWIGDIRPFLKENDEPTAFIWWSWSSLKDYATAARLAERLGKRPKCLDEYWFYSKIQIILLIVGVVVFIIGTRFEN